MANLIPPNAKRAIVIEYWIRVVTVWFILIGFAIIVVAILKLPTLALVKSQIGTFGEAYDGARAKNEIFEESQRTIIDANNLSKLLSDQQESAILSDLIDVLDTIAGSEVAISRFTFEKDELAVAKISIAGHANTRTALADFSTHIEEHALFEKAELPISNLAKDKDITFNIDIVPTAQQ